MSAAHSDGMGPMRTELLILQPTPFCNLDCSYCYLPARGDKARMSRQVLDAAFAKVLGSGLARGAMTVVWHAGEPLVLPPDWYEDAFDRAARHRPARLELGHSFQSNGTLLDERWVAFLRRTDAKLSLSIDGPDWLHDRNRRTRRGGGTHARTMRGLRLVQEAGLPSAVITVLTRTALDHADALFDFYRDAGVRDVAFNVEELEGAHASSSLLHGSAERAYRGFMSRFLARMRAEPGTLVLRELRQALGALAGGVPLGGNQEAEPLRIVSIGVDGSVSTFSPELLGMRDDRYDDFVFGNVLTDPMEAIVERVLASRLHADIAAGLADCRRSCAWFDWCGGGSPSNKIFETGGPRATETVFCRLTRKALLEMVLRACESRELPTGALLAA